MQNKKIIKIPAQQMVGVAKDFGLGDCSLTLHPDWVGLSIQDLLLLLEQTFEAGTNWNEKYSKVVKSKGSFPGEIKVPNFQKYLKKIQ